jgi:hypothetical protein
MTDLVYKEIYPKIFVYSNIFKDLDSLLGTIIESEINPEGSMINPWETWYTFGLEADNFIRNAEPTPRVIKEREVLGEIDRVLFEVADDYFKKHNVTYTFDTFVDPIDGKTKNKWQKMGPSICKYNANSGVTEDLAMHYHTDYQIEKKDARGYNFSVTVTMYLNDDYEGGGIDFYINDKLFYYKPKAGDVIVFPAGDPGFLTEGDELYHHGVRKVVGAPKYFIRNNLLRFNEGTEEWSKNQQLYGEEIWAQMERERWKKDRENGVYQQINKEHVMKARRLNDI